MADQQFDVSAKFKELFLKKREQRNEVKSYYKKLVSNPHRSEGILYDPILQRYHAMSQYSVEFHRATPRNVMNYIGFLFLPIASFACYYYFRQYYKEKMYRSGQVAYKDRICKRIL